MNDSNTLTYTAPSNTISSLLLVSPHTHTAPPPSRRCAPQPRSDLLAMNNPTCDVRTYVGGQTSCHHMWSLLDADQPIPWVDQPLVYVSVINSRSINTCTIGYPHISCQVFQTSVVRLHMVARFPSESSNLTCVCTLHLTPSQVPPEVPLLGAGVQRVVSPGLEGTG